MYAIPINDKSAFAIQDENPKAWHFHYIDFDPVRVDSFEAPYGGVVASATINPITQAVWMIARGVLFAASRELRVAVPLPLPEKDIVAFDVTLIGNRYYIAADSASVWYYDKEAEKWVSVMRPKPPPDMPPRTDGESAANYTARTSPAMIDYARKHPDLYKTFAVGNDHYFVGALGYVIGLRGDTIDETWIDSGVRLVDGFAEGGQAILCGDDPVAEIYRGTLDNGFERIYWNDDRPLHKSALYEGVRYIGAALDPEYAGPSLFTWDEEELTPITTGCAREPGNLLQLVSTGSVLWAIDEAGFFRLKSDGWTLTELADIENGDGQT